jgi:hypothetical protein
MHDNGLGGTRRFDLDWIRIGAFMLLILYHVGMLYVPWEYHVKSTHRVPQLVPLMLALNPWRLALLFLVAGAATRFMTGTRSTGRLFASRSARLLPPLVFGMLVVVPPQSYFQVVQKHGFTGGFLDFYLGHYLAFGPDFCAAGRCIMLPTWNHLWFVVYLWVYTALLAAVLAAFPALPARVDRMTARTLSGPALFVGPVLLLSVFRIVLFPMFPETHALFGDWYAHALYAAFFLFGFFFAPNPQVRGAIVRGRWAALLGAAAAYAIFMLPRLLPDTQTLALGPALKVSGPVAYAAYQWLCTLAVLGFAARWLTRDSPARRYLTDAVFPYFIIHQTAIVAAAFALRDAGLPAPVEGAVIVLATAASCALGYEVVRRIGWLRPLFGLKLRPAANARRDAAAVAA